MDSILNEMKIKFKRGQKITYITPLGQEKNARYVMASSAEGYVVADRGNGQPVVIPIEKIIK